VEAVNYPRLSVGLKSYLILVVQALLPVLDGNRDACRHRQECLCHMFCPVLTAVSTFRYSCRATIILTAPGLPIVKVAHNRRRVLCYSSSPSR
jgi:hypothetical protein